MALLTIPDQYKTGLPKIASLDTDSVEELLSALRSTDPAIYNTDVIRKLSEKVRSIPSADIQDIVRSLFGLSVGRVSSEVSIDNFVNDIVESISLEMSDSGKPIVPDERRDLFRQNLALLLDVASLKIGAKAYDVLVEHEHTLTDSRILTDVRPIFGDEVGDRPAAAVIVHTLKINYMQGRQRKEFFVAMDTSDIQELIDTLERAKTKAEALKAVLALTKIPYVDVQ